MTSPPAGRFAVPFKKFRRILECNNAVIEKIGDMESALGGEYVFDQAFLRSAVATLGKLVREVVYSLNDLSDNSFLPLYERFEAIHNHLQDLVSPGPGPYAERLILPYYLINRDLDHLVGAKNANLGEIRNYLHLPTPDGFALTGAAYNLFMEENDLFAGVTKVLQDSTDNKQRATQIEKLFAAAVMPKVLKETVQENLETLIDNIGPKKQLAVRSSAVGEDGVRTFAGQFLTLLPVQPKWKAVLAACQQLFAARFAARVLDYLDGDEDVRAVPMAIAVQEYIPVREAGVIYSLDATTSQDQELLTITATKGAGAELVSGRTDGDRYHLSRQYPFVPVRSVLCGEPADDPFQRGPSGLRQGSATVPREFFSRLAEAGMLLEKAFGRPQDVEWGRDENGQLVILQCRHLHLPERPPPQP
ncbi:MAG: PEP/pyruvate-binding domain-containing protein, partial [Desulfobulbaceae bacterium]|nr:PEP/pyruvate-binding domain-containing protein [Desulfobulbaceae bacterium]